MGNVFHAHLIHPLREYQFPGAVENSLAAFAFFSLSTFGYSHVNSFTMQ